MQSDLWGEASRVRASERWASAAAGWGRALTDALIEAAGIEPDSVVLDLACGSGDPALDILSRFPSVRVVGVDRSSPGLVLASESSTRDGVGSRVVFLQGDVHALPIAAESVNRVTCRCGVMFFDDVYRAVREIRRVLKPEGRLALLAWGPFDQPFFAGTMGVLLERVPGTELPVEGRRMCRFATPGALEEPLRKAGFRTVDERHITVSRVWRGSPEQLWEYQQEVGAFFRPLFESISPSLRPEIDAEVARGLARFRAGNALVVPAEVVLAVAT
jgi:SAM-dependent methyltransferase